MPQPASALSPQSDPINPKTASVVHPREWMPCPSCPLCSGVPKTRHFTSYKQATDHALLTSTDRRLGGRFGAGYARQGFSTPPGGSDGGRAIWGTLNADAVAGMRRPPRAGSAEAGAAGLLQRLEPRAAGRQVRDAGEYGEDVAAPQHDGYPGVSWTLMAYSEDDIALAAEYALGTLDADERAQVETMMAVDKEFTAMVQAWEYRLGVLNQMVGSVEPAT